jgi:hypothetical protein
VASLFGYAPVPVVTAPVKKKKKMFGGRLAPPPQTITRFLLSDIEDAIHEAGNGNLQLAAQFARAIVRDGKTRGVLSTRTDGLVRLPIQITGREDMARELAGDGTTKGVFAQKFPIAELAKIAADGILLGVGVGQMVPDPTGKVDTIFRRLDPYYLQYRVNDNAWWYMAYGGAIKITPGDGEWILHLPGGEDEPWTHGLWMPLARSYVAKDHAFMSRQAYAATLANPARLAFSKPGSTEVQRKGLLTALKNWGLNTVFALPDGWDAKLLESNGRGFECFQAIIAEANEEIIICIAGQLVSTNGTSGFSSGELHKTIRADLIQATGDSLAYTLNTQGIPPWVNRRFGGDALEESPEMGWDVTPPADHQAQAVTIGALGDGLAKADAALKPHGYQCQAKTIAIRFGVDVEEIPNPAPAPVVEPAKAPADPADPADPAPEQQTTNTSDDELPLMPNAAASLAEMMTQYSIPRCEHGSSNICRKCGIERERVLIPPKKKGGEHSWGIKWKPIEAPVTHEEAT